MHCQTCKFFYQLKCSNLNQPFDVYYKTESDLIYNVENYGICSNPKVAFIGNIDMTNKELAESTNDFILFSDAGECPEIFVGINFGCIHHEKKAYLELYGSSGTV